MEHRVSINIPEVSHLEDLISRHEHLVSSLRANLRAIEGACMEIEIKLNQPAVSAPADS